MKTLITGASGFVGSYLIEYLQKNGFGPIAATKLPGEAINNENIAEYDLNLLDTDEIRTLLQRIQPEYVFHLAAQSSVALSWKDPGTTVDVNIKGTINLLETIVGLHCRPRILLIGSGEEYGHIQESDIPIKENTLSRPGNIYAATKVMQNMIGRIYNDAYGLDIMMVRAFNHAGPKQMPSFVLSDFCRQVAQIEAGIQEPIISVGNLLVKRDFTDVRDVVRAYALLMKYGQNGETYNIGSGSAVEIKTILNFILSLSAVQIEVKNDSTKARPTDISIIEADITKIKACTGWHPEIKLEDTIKDTLEYWRTEANWEEITHYRLEQLNVTKF